MSFTPATQDESPDELTPYLLQFIGATASGFRSQLAGSAVMLAVLWGFVLAQGMEYFASERKKEDGWCRYGLGFLVLSQTIQFATWLYQTFDVLLHPSAYISLLRTQTLLYLASYLVVWTVTVPICLSYFASNAMRMLGRRWWLRGWLYGGIGAGTGAGAGAIIYFMTLPIPKDPSLSVMLSRLDDSWLSSTGSRGARITASYDSVLLLIIGRSIIEAMLPTLVVASVGCGFFLWGKSILIPVIFFGPAMPPVWCVCTFMAIRNREKVTRKLRVITNIGVSIPGLELELAPTTGRDASRVELEMESEVRMDYATSYDTGPTLVRAWSNDLSIKSPLPVAHHGRSPA